MKNCKNTINICTVKTLINEVIAKALQNEISQSDPVVTVRNWLEYTYKIMNKEIMIDPPTGKEREFFINTRDKLTNIKKMLHRTLLLMRDNWNLFKHQEELLQEVYKLDDTVSNALKTIDAMLSDDTDDMNSEENRL